ncbi:MAG: hypothetical protein CM1200mP6_05280 [Anaerolineaceae bacterium]|nr:MAG: hypothetical protein CM1200mP6_05280 [Anaerolineaceae bacterium]
MDVDNFDQMVLNASALQDALPYLLEGMQVGVTEYEGEALKLGNSLLLLRYQSQNQK